MRWVLILLLIILIGWMVAAAWAFQQWGGWGLAGVIGLFIGSIWLLLRLGPRLFFWMLTRPVREMAKVLHGATVEVHAIATAPPPEYLQLEPVSESGYDDDDDDASIVVPRDWYYLDLTVTPVSARHVDSDVQAVQPRWFPAALTCIEPAEGTHMPYAVYQGETCDVASFRIWRQDRFQESTTGEVLGTQRLQLHVGVRSGVSTLRLVYYTERLAEVTLPRPPTWRASALLPVGDE